MGSAQFIIEVKDLDIGYGDCPVMQNLNFGVNKGDIFIVMGQSGCGKSTLLKSMIGLKEPLRGKVLINGKSFWDEDENGQLDLMRHFGVIYQSGALWSSMTVGENVPSFAALYKVVQGTDTGNRSPKTFVSGPGRP